MELYYWTHRGQECAFIAFAETREEALELIRTAIPDRYEARFISSDEVQVYDLMEVPIERGTAYCIET